MGNYCKQLFSLSIVVLLISCGSASNPPKQSIGHITKANVAKSNVLEQADIPTIVRSSPYVPLPKPHKKPETYTVVVNNVPVKELLFAIARDANIDIDIVGDITGTVTLNAIDKTLSQILERIAQHTDIKYNFKNNYLIIEKDIPYFKTYHVDYVNLERESTSNIELATQIASAGATGDGEGVGNNSSTVVKNTSTNAFWKTLQSNLNQIVNISEAEVKVKEQQENADSSDTNERPESSSSEEESADSSGEGDAATATSKVIINKEAGLINIFTTDKIHRKITTFIDTVVSKSRKQVLIEATIVEVELNDEYKSGVDWSVVNTSGTGLSLNQSFTGAGSISTNAFTGTFADPLNALGNVTATIKALEQFGDVQILSSPKVIAINNQIAVIKVVDNRVYFTTSVEVTPATGTTARVEVFTSELHTVPIGFVMNVTPSIDQNDEILLNVRPTISRILNRVKDPNPELTRAGITSEIPEIQVREMETLLRMNSGQTAIIGGLMQDKVEKREVGIPGLNKIPAIGFLFGSVEESITKTELLVFIKSTIVDAASIDNELKDYYDFVPDASRASHLSPSERAKK